MLEKTLAWQLIFLALVASMPAFAQQEGLDKTLLELAQRNGLNGQPESAQPIPPATAPLVILGRQLFFTKSLGGGFDVACASCHHPALGGGDELSLSIGIDAVDPDIVGPMRRHIKDRPRVPRNAPTTFNVAFWQTAMFWDGRVERLAEGFRTPESPYGVADPQAGDELVAVQSRFPMASVEEMRTRKFEQGAESQAVRNHLAARLGGYGVGLRELKTNAWLAAFRQGFNSMADAESLVTEQHIAEALSAYQRSQQFTQTPWRAYLSGDKTALSAQQKQGAILFFRTTDEGGADCASCHRGDFFTDEQYHRLGVPQIGHGKHNTNKDDFGRSRETRDDANRYQFRTPSLLNVTATGPYMHNGAYDDLAMAIRHHLAPEATVKAYWQAGGYCQLDQFTAIAECASLYPQSELNSQRALAYALNQPSQASEYWQRLPAAAKTPAAVQALVAFMAALTDPCVFDDECLEAWLPPPGPGPDGMQLNAIIGPGVTP